ncbi:MAG: efflux transporter outer membrane subunit [Chlamydiales bacterium]
MRIWGVLLIFFGGCMVGPRYQTPEVAMPEQFSEGQAPISDEDLCQWWKQFGDPILDEVIDEVIQGNYDFRIAVEQIIEARAQFQIQNSTLWPTIDLNAVAVRQRFSQNLFTTAANAVAFASGTTTSGIGAITGPPVQNFFQFGFDAVWELDFWGKFRRGKQAALDQWEASQFLADNILITAIGEGARDYIAIRSLQRQIEVLRKKIAADARELQLLQVLFDAGIDNEIQIQNQIATLQSDQAALPVLETSLKETVYALAVLMGKPPEELSHRFNETGRMPLFCGKVPAGLPSDLLRRRPDIRASERQLAAATEQIGIAISALFPSIALTGNGYGYEANTFSKLFKHGSSLWGIGPSINWDLIDFGKTRGQIDAANSVQRQALLSYEQTVISALQDVEGALVAYFDEERRNGDITAQLAADARSLALTNDLWQAGLASELESLGALKTLLDAESTLIQSEQALAADLISLYKALGGNWQCSSTP